MGNSNLQVRRDTLADHAAAPTTPLLGEPLLVTDEHRVRIGINDPGRVAVGVDLVPYVGREGIQYSVLWAQHEYGGSAGIKVPAVNLNSQDATWYALTGQLSRHSLNDGCVVKVHATGSYYCGSGTPAMNFALALGPPVGGTITRLVPVDGTLADGTTFTSGGIEVSNRTVGAFPFGQGNEDLRWELDLTASFLGYNGAGKFASNGGDGRARIHGRLSWGTSQGPTGGFRTSVGPLTSAGYTAAESWNPIRGSNYSAGDVVVVHGKAYRARLDIATQPDAGFSADTVLELMSLVTPGQGAQWREYWDCITDCMDFSYEAEVDLDTDGAALSLLAGGPHQSDFGSSAFPSWTAGGGGAYDPAADDLSKVVVSNGQIWTPETYHLRTASLEPGGAGEYQRQWRQLDTFRRDQMVIDSSTAILFGGRAGVADRTIL